MRKRRILNPAAAQAQLLADIAGRFEFPDVDTVGDGGRGIAAGGGGGMMTVSIAASDAHDIEKERADYRCTGTGDEDVIQAAADLIHEDSANAGGTIWLSSGDFNIDTMDSLDIGNDITLRGVTSGDTRLVTTATSGDILNTGVSARVRDVTFAGPGGGNTLVAMDLGNGNTITNVEFNGVKTGIQPGNQCIVERCRVILNSQILVDDQSNASQSVIITGCNEVGAVKIGEGQYWLITGNTFTSSIDGDGCDYIAIVDNNWVSPSPQNNAQIELDNCNYFVITGNAMTDANTWNGIELDTCTEGTIAGNTLGNVLNGVVLASCARVNVNGNMIGAESYIEEHGISFTDTSDCLVEGNLIYFPGQGTDNTYDGIILAGNSDRNDIWNNKIIGDSGAVQPRYGINISAATCNDNSYLGNRTGPASDYGTGAYVDSGTGTVNTWPGAAAPQGDNLL